MSDRILSENQTDFCILLLPTQMLKTFYQECIYQLHRVLTKWGQLGEKENRFHFLDSRKQKRLANWSRTDLESQRQATFFCNLSSWTNVNNFLSLGGRMDQRCWLRWWRPAQFWGVQVQPVREFGSNIVFSIISHTIYTTIKKLYWYMACAHS